MRDSIGAVQRQSVTDFLGTLHHNTISRKMDDDKVVVEPRPTFAGSTKVATGDYGRGVFSHRGLPLYVTEDKIATSVASTTIVDTELNPNAKASFDVLDSGSDRITIVQNAGFEDRFGAIWYGTTANSFQIDSYQASGENLDTTGQLTASNSITISPDGVHLYAMYAASATIAQYDFGVPGDITSVVYQGLDIGPVALSTAVAIHISSDGTKMYFLTTGSGNYYIEEVALGTAWDITSLASTVTHTLDISAQLTIGRDLVFNKDDSSAYVIDGSTDDIFQYNLGTPGTLSTGSYASKSLDLSSESTSDWVAVMINNAEDKIYACDAGGDTIFEYTLSTPGDVDTGSYTSRSLDPGFGIRSLAMATSGDAIYINDTSNEIEEYLATDTFTKVTDAQSPGTPSETIMIRGVAVVNGYVFAADINGNIYNCDNGDITAWDALSVVAAERKPDFGCAIFEHKDHVVYLGTRSMEFFYFDGSASGSPVQRRPDVFYNIGSVFPNSVAQQGDITYFIGTDAQGDTDIYVLENFTPTPLNNAYIKSLLRDLDVDRYVNPYTSDPTNFLQILVPYTTADAGKCLLMTINGTTYNYCMNTGLIAKWYPGDAPASLTGLFTSDWDTEELLPIMGIHNNGAIDDDLFAIFSNGYASGATFNGDLDDVGAGTAASSFYYTKMWNADTLERKRVKWLRIHQYPQMDSSLTNSNVTLQWVDKDNNDDFGAALTDADFTGGRTIDLLYARGYTPRLGACRERIYKLTLTPAKSQLIAGFEKEYDNLRG